MSIGPVQGWVNFYRRSWVNSTPALILAGLSHGSGGVGAVDRWCDTGGCHDSSLLVWRGPIGSSNTGGPSLSPFIVCTREAIFFCFPRGSGSGSGGEGRQGCPQGQSGGPFRVPVCLAHEGDLSPLSAASTLPQAWPMRPGSGRGALRASAMAWGFQGGAGPRL